MPPKKTVPPSLDPVAVRREFSEASSEVMSILTEESSKLIEWRSQAQEEYSKTKVVPQKLRLRMTGSIQALVLPFQHYTPKELEILREELGFVTLVRKVAAVLMTHKSWCMDNNLGFSFDSANRLLTLSSELKTEARERREKLQAAALASLVPTEGSVVDEDVTMSEPASSRGRGKVGPVTTLLRHSSEPLR
ncbi:hypothetical protein MD484_g9062, partial [Candolleomyces efflorescens]